MKANRWYRVFEIVNGAPVLKDTTRGNWFETMDEAEEIILERYMDFNPESTFTILPVYGKRTRLLKTNFKSNKN